MDNIYRARSAYASHEYSWNDLTGLQKPRVFDVALPRNAQRGADDLKRFCDVVHRNPKHQFLWPLCDPIGTLGYLFGPFSGPYFGRGQALPNLWVGVMGAIVYEIEQLSSAVSSIWRGPRYIECSPFAEDPGRIKSSVFSGGLDWVIAAGASLRISLDGKLKEDGEDHAKMFTHGMAEVLRGRCADYGIPFWCEKLLRYECPRCHEWAWEGTAGARCAFTPGCKGKIRPEVKCPEFSRADGSRAPYREAPPIIDEILNSWRIPTTDQEF